MSITLQIEEDVWRPLRLQAKLRRAAAAALAHVQARGSLTILLTDDARLHALNKAFRDKDASTNVLSFPATDGAPGYLGDIAIAYGVAGREAAETGKTFSDHVLHLAVHGTLHLAGFDHIRPDEAAVMERAEIEILATMGIADPYVLSSPDGT